MENIKDTVLVDMAKVENLLRNKMVELQLRTVIDGQFFLLFFFKFKK